MLNKTVFLIATLGVLGGSMTGPALSAGEDGMANRLEQGKAIAFNRVKGNCLACHHIEGGELTGNFGPPLLAMKVRYTDRDVLRAQIWDATVKNPLSIMPPMGKHNILTEDEIDAVVEYIYQY